MGYKTLILLLITAASCIAKETTAPLIAPHNVCAEIEISRFEGDHFWDRSGDSKKAYNHLKRTMAEFTFEKGISSQDNILAYVNYTVINETLHGDEDSFGDAEIAYKRKLIGGYDQILTAEARAIIPVGDYIPEIRYGCFGGQLGLLYGKTFFINEKKLTLDTMIAYRGYSGFPSDQMRGHLYGFLDWNERLQIKGALEGVFGFYNGKSERRHSFFFYNANFRVLIAELSAKAFVSDRVAIYGGVKAPIVGAGYGQGAEIFIGFDFCLR